MKSSEIREKFIKFFEARGHKVLPGSSLVPSDPTVLLTLAGMLQFKPIFLGQEKPSYRRATTVQKCIRMVDIERVGKTPRHHTFFEMLGNFSFGDYFKKEAVQFAWELLTKEFKIPVTRLKIAIFEKDDEAFDIWHKEIGLPKEIIFRLGEDNNFWAAGPTGPCGPCSEIYYDLGPEHGCGKPDCAPGCDCDRFLEIWNLVFIQYNRNEKSELIPLQQKGIDTGMGLERIASVLQGVGDNFETDLFVPLIQKLDKWATAAEPAQVSKKIIADHVRAITHLISDGVFPSNAGRGYVLRRLVRRSVRHGKQLGINKPFLADLSQEVVESMQGAYPVLGEKNKIIRQVIREEEESFLGTLEQGLKLFEEMAAEHAGEKLIAGKTAFKLHDTYGFPIELTVELSAEKGYQVDLAGFEKEMEAQRERARQTGIEGEKKKLLVGLDLAALKPTNFTGHEKTSEETKAVALFPAQKLVVLEKTPFYGESGGQIGDTGIFSWNGKETRVLNTIISTTGVILHEVDELDGLKENTRVLATIDTSKRKATEAHHTATHLLHKALREVLGEHVKQAGSYVGPDKLRFDFTHFHALAPDELQKIELAVNKKISEKIKVEVLHRSYKDARKMEAVALFGEKYGDQVRILKVGDYSLELCGGTHVKSTADILFFKIISEGALGSGIRRIEALAGQAAKVFSVYQAKSLRDEVEALIRRYKALQIEKEKLGGIRSLETNIFEIESGELESLTKAIDNQDSADVNKFLDHLSGRVDWLKERVARTEREIEKLKTNNVKSEATGLISDFQNISGTKVLQKEFKNYDIDDLMTVSGTLIENVGSGIVTLTSELPDKNIYLINMSQDIASSKGITANRLNEVFSPIVDGKGGGKPTLVKGGLKKPGEIQKGFKAITDLIAGEQP